VTTSLLLPPAMSCRCGPPPHSPISAVVETTTCACLPAPPERENSRHGDGPLRLPSIPKPTPPRTRPPSAGGWRVSALSYVTIRGLSPSLPKRLPGAEHASNRGLARRHDRSASRGRRLLHTGTPWRALRLLFERQGRAGVGRIDAGGTVFGERSWCLSATRTGARSPSGHSQRVALAASTRHGRRVRGGSSCRCRSKLRDMARKGASRHVEADVAAAAPALSRRDQGRLTARDEILVSSKAISARPWRKYRLAGEAVLAIIGRV